MFNLKMFNLMSCHRQIRRGEKSARRVDPPKAESTSGGKNLLTSLLLTIIVYAFSSNVNAQIFWNQAATFAGTANSYIAVPSSPGLNITGSFTLECWVNPSITQTSILMQKREEAKAVGYTMLLLSNKIFLRTNNTTKLEGNLVLPNNVWTHVAGTYNHATNTFSIFIDGALDSSVVFAGAAPVSNTDTLYIGTGFNGPFYGYMDNVRIWNRALSQTEIRNNRRTTIGATGGIYDGLVLSLPFQHFYKILSPFDLIDQSGNGNSGINKGVTALDLSNRPSTYLTFNEGVYLDGVGDYLAAPHVSQLNVTSFTLECWINPTNAVNPTYQNLIAKRLAGHNGYEIYLSFGKLYVRTNGITRLTGNIVIPSGQWSHFAATFDASTYKIKTYVNGVPDDSTTSDASAIPINNTDSLYIGTGWNDDFAGYIDEIRISNYVKTESQIKSFLYRSIDNSNEPSSGNINIVYNLDGNTFDNADNATKLYFRGNANFSNPSVGANVPVSPLNRADALNFPAGYYIKSSNRRIPQSGTSGTMLTDSLYIQQSLTITDLNLFLATNHTAEGDLLIRLIGPNGDSVNVYNNLTLNESDHVITIFDDGADSSLIAGRYTSFAPFIKASNNLNAIFSGDNSQGFWRLKIYDSRIGDTGRVYAWGLQFNNQTLVGVEEIISEIPKKYSLSQNYPNPFNPTTTIRFDIPEETNVLLTITNILGERVATLVDERLKAGTHQIKFDAAKLASGVYFYRLRAGDYVSTKKLLFMK